MSREQGKRGKPAQGKKAATGATTASAAFTKVPIDIREPILTPRRHNSGNRGRGRSRTILGVTEQSTSSPERSHEADITKMDSINYQQRKKVDTIVRESGQEKQTKEALRCRLSTLERSPSAYQRMTILEIILKRSEDEEEGAATSAATSAGERLGTSPAASPAGHLPRALKK